VTIDGRAYWDGGFSANPDLKTLATESPVEDTLIVLLNPLEHGDVPRSAMEIASRVSAITFNQPFVSDVEAIVAAQESEIGWFANRHSRLARLKRHRFHVIEASSYTAELGVDSKLMPNGELLRYLFNAGREEAQSWLAQHRDDIGRRSTVDLRARYLKPVATGPGDREIPPGKVPEHPDRRAAGQ
jgi:NTE family protein